MVVSDGRRPGSVTAAFVRGRVRYGDRGQRAAAPGGGWWWSVLGEDATHDVELGPRVHSGHPRPAAPVSFLDHAVVGAAIEHAGPREEHQAWHLLDGIAAQRIEVDRSDGRRHIASRCELERMPDPDLTTACGEDVSEVLDVERVNLGFGLGSGGAATKAAPVP